MSEIHEFFNRQIKLWGEETQDSLQNKKVAIIGSGGLGCSLGIALGASGIGEFTLVDFDEVGVHNIHRQIGFKVGDDGKYKADVLKELMESRCPYTKVTAYKESFQDFAKRGLEFDLIIDATDNLPTRAAINEYCISKNQPWIYGSVEEFHGQVCFFEKASYEAVFQINDRKPNGIACPIVMHIASLQANLAIRYLAGLTVKKDILYYLSFDNDGVLQNQKFNLPTK
ncbi:HesA/MoeB/ThiF family protein [Arcobacter sp. CECT 8986]|uniref:HesA/MoeB/ThiF family protein n=1 Tax=Arcobacter sp. CECT 8986 TaxID=2044507 RepID=UPI002159D92D|nr:ThiF family adenylyltransferase [Arcobacter sp. CECT 8986]